MKHASIIVAIGLALAATLPTASANAQNARSFVSGQGSDSNSCTLAAPCRTFAFAITRTNAGGEILTLNPAGYGPVTIDKSISIVSSPGAAGVNILTAGTAITINAAATDTVSLRGLTIDGLGIGAFGIVFNSGGKLTIDQCHVQNFTSQGILIQPTSGNHNIVITKTTASNNGSVGVHYAPPSGNAATGIVIDRVSANNNVNGIAIDNGSSSGAAMASISNSIASLNTNNGFHFANVTVSLDASNAASNGNNGVSTSVGTTLALGRSVLMNNGQFGLNTTGGGQVIRYNDNRMDGNGAGPLLGPTGVGTLY